MTGKATVYSQDEIKERIYALEAKIEVMEKDMNAARAKLDEWRMRRSIYLVCYQYIKPSGRTMKGFHEWETLEGAISDARRLYTIYNLSFIYIEDAAGNEVVGYEEIVEGLDEHNKRHES